MIPIWGVGTDDTKTFPLMQAVTRELLYAYTPIRLVKSPHPIRPHPAPFRTVIARKGISGEGGNILASLHVFYISVTFF